MDYIVETSREFTPDKVPSDKLKKCAKKVIEELLNRAKKLDSNDKRVSRMIKRLEGSMNTIYDSSYNTNAISVEVNDTISEGKDTLEFVIKILKSKGFIIPKNTKGSSDIYIKKFDDSTVVAKLIEGKAFGRSTVTIVLYTTSNVNESTIFESVQML